MYELFCRLVLKLYPRSFRNEFSGESLLLLRDRWRNETGLRLRMGLLLDIIFDTCRSLLHEHAREEFTPLAAYDRASTAPVFTILIDAGPRPAALCGGAFAAGFALLFFAMLLLPGNGTRPPYAFLHYGAGGFGSWLLRITHTQQPRQEFEAASVKPAAPQGIMFVRPLPGRLTANASLQLLMQNAYGVQAFQLVGGPDWLKFDRYAVEATAGSSVTRPQILLMLQTLLEERFQLKVHRETRELPVFALVAARNSIKLQTAKDGTCAESDSNALPDWAGGIMAPPGAGTASLPQCGIPRLMLQPDGARMQGRRVRMTDIARALSLVTDRMVIDQTDVSGLFDIDLTFLPDDTTAAMPPPPPGMAATLALRTPTILPALQEQFGLRLESTKGPVEVIVIEHAQKPPQ